MSRELITETVTEPRTVRRWTDPICDWCGITDDDAYAQDGWPLTPITLSINEGEEGGERWSKHACGNCFVRVADALRGLGYVGGLLADAEAGVDAMGNTYGSAPEPHITPDRDEDD